MSPVNGGDQARSTQNWREWAPRSVRSEADASERLAQAARRWWVECREATVRAHMHGYQVHLGIGKFLRHEGVHASFEVAEGVAVDAVRDERHLALGVIRTQILPGWSDDTPFQGATLGTAMHGVPLLIRRAPYTNAELGTDADGIFNRPPVVAIYQHGSVVRPAVEIPWDDERSRAAAAARYAEGMQRKEAEIAAALQQFAQKEATASLVLDRRLTPHWCTATGGETVYLLGTVRLAPDGTAEARIAHLDRTRAWLPIDAIDQLTDGIRDRSS